MKLKFNEIVALILIAIGLFDLYFIPKIILKTSSGMTKEQREKVISILKIASYATIALGIIFLLGIIPISD